MSEEQKPLDPEFTWGKSAVGDIVQRRNGGPRMTFVCFDRNGLAICEWTEMRRGWLVREKEVRRRGLFACRDLVRLESPHRSAWAEEMLGAFGMDRQGS